MALTTNQITSLAYQAGFRGNALREAVAVALAESGGNPNAYNPETAAGTRGGRGSFGLWQIYLTAHPEYGRTNLYDPLQNARAAFAVYSQAGGRFTPWSTYNLGMADSIARNSKIDVSKSTGIQTSGGAHSGYVMTGGPPQKNNPIVGIPSSILPSTGLFGTLQDPKSPQMLAIAALGVIVLVSGFSLLTASLFSKEK